MWHVSLAKYFDKPNACRERTVAVFENEEHEAAHEYIENHADRAIYLWNDCDETCTTFAWTSAYKREWAKIVD